jgi:hypothetical protein
MQMVDKDWYIYLLLFQIDIEHAIFSANWEVGR